ncbi:MAG TPA: CotH kinase family protein [Bacteroidota bacterium]|nr:CotH kinase family protein [Bacteroidota bacterium]
MNYLLILCLLCAAAAPGQLPQYNVTMSSADYDTLYERDPFSDVYLPCTFEFQGTNWNSVQVKFKGHSTRYYPKKAYRLKFPSANQFQGAVQINFNAMYTDKSFLREKLTWDLFEEMGFLAPRAHHARLSNNGVDKGLYLFIDKIDKNFLVNRGRVSAPMYEADDIYISADMTLQPDSILKLWYDKDIGSASDYSDLTQLLTAINNAPDSSFADTVVKYFDITSVLNWFAGNTLTMMGDSYTKNYYLYRDTSKATGQWVIIPWDYDLSFGRSGDLAVPYPASLLNDNFAYTYPPLSGPPNVLKDRFLATPSLKEMLRQRVDTLLQTLFTESHLFPRIDSLVALIESDAMADPYKWGTNEDVIEQAAALKYYITARRNFLNKTFVNPPAGNYNDVTLHPTQLGVPYHFVAYDGRQIASLWFSAMSGLDSIRVRAYPNLIPSNVQNQGEGKYVKRWLRVTPYPASATFTAKLEWMYNDVSSTDREVGIGVQDERLLHCYYYNGSSFVRIASAVNAFGNFVDVDPITEANCDSTMYFALLQPESYTQKWFRQSNNYWQRWYDIKFADAVNGFAVGDQGTLLRTTDAGLTWSADSIGIGLPFRSIAIPALNNLFAAGEHGALYRSIDTGKTWSRIDLGTFRGLRGVTFLNSQKGWVFGEGGTLFETNNGGDSWSGGSPDTAGTIIGIAAFSANSLTIFFEDGHATQTSNGGATWSPFSPILNVPKLRKVEVFGANDIYAIGDSGAVIHNVSSSAWVNLRVPTASGLSGIHILSQSSLYVCGENGDIYYSNDNGSTWYKQYSADSHDLNAIVFTDSVHGYAVGNAGTILTTMSPGTVTGVRPGTQLPGEYRLYQNFPNPFNPTTQIRFELRELSTVRLTVYDVLGQRVATLQDGVLQAGSYDLPYSGNKLASGVYFYRLDVREPFGGTLRYSQVNKMLLLK